MFVHFLISCNPVPDVLDCMQKAATLFCNQSKASKYICVHMHLYIQFHVAFYIKPTDHLRLTKKRRKNTKNFQIRTCLPYFSMKTKKCRNTHTKIPQLLKQPCLQNYRVKSIRWGKNFCFITPANLNKHKVCPTLLPALELHMAQVKHEDSDLYM